MKKNVKSSLNQVCYIKYKNIENENEVLDSLNGTKLNGSIIYLLKLKKLEIGVLDLEKLSFSKPVLIFGIYNKSIEEYFDLFPEMIGFKKSKKSKKFVKFFFNNSIDLNDFELLKYKEDIQFDE
jgi:RNA recognition motif-containing protein